MKKIGTKHHLLRWRDAELLTKYKEIINETDDLGWENVYRTLAESPASRFWVSEQRALEAVRAILSGHRPCTSRLRKEMYETIKERALHLYGSHEVSTLEEAVAEVVNSPAPKFYITPISAMTIVSRTKKQKAAEIMRKLKFLRG